MNQYQFTTTAYSVNPSYWFFSPYEYGSCHFVGIVGFQVQIPRTFGSLLRLYLPKSYALPVAIARQSGLGGRGLDLAFSHECIFGSGARHRPEADSAFDSDSRVHRVWCIGEAQGSIVVVQPPDRDFAYCWVSVFLSRQPIHGRGSRPPDAAVWWSYSGFGLWRHLAWCVGLRR